MLHIQNRTELPEAATSGGSCCSPAGHAVDAPSAVELPGAGTPAGSPPAFPTDSDDPA